MNDQRVKAAMSTADRDRVVNRLLDRYGTTYAQEIGIKVESNTPSPLFRLLCASLLFSARISADIAVRASKALAREGWTTAAKMAASTWSDRAMALNQAGYARYDERTSTMLGQTAEMLVERYRGDLRKLREEAGRDPSRERVLLKQFKGIGDTGVDIFFREVQVAWDEIAPFADGRALEAASHLGLGTNRTDLARLVSGSDFARLVAALVRVELRGAYGEFEDAAA